MGWYGYPKYVPVAMRRAEAKKKMEKLQKTGENVHPIGPLPGRGLIAKSFWGKAWCKHMQAFSDYENRLPRGRTYVRNGSVCHLSIEKGIAKAKVSGSEMYDLSIHFEPLDAKKWEKIKQQCTGKIGSLIELLQGKISDEIMAVVTDPTDGLFPHPKEIRFDCNCPDWADMCKHVAAAMYGIGVRLDTEPELLFKLRGVDHKELISVDVNDITDSKNTRRRTLRDDSVGDVFGIELEDELEDAAAPEPTPETAPFKPTGATVRKLRKDSGLNRGDFATEIGVSNGTITNWEKVSGVLRLQPNSLQGLEEFHKRNT